MRAGVVPVEACSVLVALRRWVPKAPHCSWVGQRRKRCRSAMHEGPIWVSCKIHWEPTKRLRLLSLWLVFVVWMLLHVGLSQSLGLINIRSLLLVSQTLPLGPKSLADLRVVHLWVLISDFLSHLSGPDHEGIHRSLDLVIVIFTTVGRVSTAVLARLRYDWNLHRHWVSNRVAVAVVRWRMVPIELRHDMHHEVVAEAKKKVWKK